MLPASTTAITMIFFPALSAINGLGLRAGTVGSGEKAQGNIRRIKDCEEVGCGGVRTVGGGTADDNTGIPAGAAPPGDPTGNGENKPAAGTDAPVAGAWGGGIGGSIGRRCRGNGRGSSGSTSNKSVSSCSEGIGVVRALFEQWALVAKARKIEDSLLDYDNLEVGLWRRRSFEWC